MVGAAVASDVPIAAVSTLGEANDIVSAPGAWTSLAVTPAVNYIAWPGGYNLILMVNVTAPVADGYLNISAGDNPPAFRSGIGDMVITGWTDGSNEVRFIGPLESARFMSSTGYLNMTSYNLTGTVAVLKVLDNVA